MDTTSGDGVAGPSSCWGCSCSWPSRASPSGTSSIREDAPEQANIDTARRRSTRSAPAAPSPPTTWPATGRSTPRSARSTTSAGTWAGYRFDEELAQIGSTTAVGRTPDVSGSMTVADDEVTGVEVDVDMTTLQSDQSFRDEAIRSTGPADQRLPHRVVPPDRARRPARRRRERRARPGQGERRADAPRRDARRSRSTSRPRLNGRPRRGRGLVARGHHRLRHRRPRGRPRPVGQQRRRVRVPGLLRQVVVGVPGGRSDQGGRQGCPRAG